MFEPIVYLARRRALIEGLSALGVKTGLVSFAGHGESPVNYANNAYRFRQDSSFIYYFGLQSPGLAATVDLGAGRAFLYADGSSIDDLVWTGPVPGVDELRASCGADEARPRRGFADAVAAAGDSALFLPPYRAETAVELAEALGIRPPEVALKASAILIRAVVAQREIKAPHEIAEMEKAVDTSVDMHLAVMRAAAPGVTEAALAAEACRVAAAAGGAVSFEPIATSRGDVLHNPSYDGVLARGRLFLLDAGAESAEGYAGDLTSAFPVGGRFDERQKAVYEIVLAAGRAASATIKPGTPYLKAHLAAARAVAVGLKDIGVMRGDPDEAVSAGAYACFFPHGVGHQIGLDVHDMESLGEDAVGYGELARDSRFGFKSLRMAKPLKAGMALTVEPGVYFIGGLIESWRGKGLHEAFIDYAEASRWIGFGGIRNEEDWLVTPDGGRRLGKPFDKSVRAIEGYVAKA